MKLDELRPLFVAESSQLLQQMEKSLAAVQREQRDEIAINTACRALHTIKSLAAVLGLKHVELFTERVEKLLDRLGDGLLLPDRTLITLLEEVCSQLAVLIDAFVTLEHVSTGVQQRSQALNDYLESYLQPSSATRSNVLPFVRPRNKVAL